MVCDAVVGSFIDNFASFFGLETSIHLLKSDETQEFDLAGIKFTTVLTTHIVPCAGMHI